MSAEQTPTVPPAREALRRRLAFHAALLFLVGGLTGGYVSAAMSGMVKADPKIALAAHIVAIQGSAWLIGLAWTLRWSRLGPGAERLLGVLVLSATWGNWAVTSGKAAFFVHGVAPTGERANDVVFGLLTVLVVLPTLAAAAMWVWGLCGGAPREGGA